MYPVTPTLSELATHARETLPDLEMTIRRFPGAVGGAASTGVVGVGVGVAVGAAVGIGVGVGVAVGAAVGIGVGAGDGVGPSVGVGIGPSVGDGVGPSVGAGVADGDGESLGAGNSPTEILTSAPSGDTDRVVIVVPVTGSTRVIPAASGASMNEVVAGFVSTSWDWVSDVYAPVIRTVTPVATGLVAAITSNSDPYGCRYSSANHEVGVRGIRRAVTLDPRTSAGASMKSPDVVTVWEFSSRSQLKFPRENEVG